MGKRDQDFRIWREIEFKLRHAILVTSQPSILMTLQDTSRPHGQRRTLQEEGKHCRLDGKHWFFSPRISNCLESPEVLRPSEQSAVASQRSLVLAVRQQHHERRRSD